MSTGTKGLDGKLGPLILKCKEAVDAVPLALLDWVKVFGLRGA